MQWDDLDCLLRYRRLESTRPELFARSPQGAFRILPGEPMIERAKADAAALRAKHGMSHEDLRVGVLADDPYVVALREAVEFPDGRFGLYNRFIVPAGVVVLPLLGADIVVMYRYRHGTRSWHYEFPRGIVEPGENDREAVRRELLEEIGGRADDVVALGEVHSSSGITNERSETFLARLIELGQPDRHEAVRRIDVLGVENFRRKVAAGEITDGPTLAAYTQAAARGLLR